MLALSVLCRRPATAAAPTLTSHALWPRVRLVAGVWGRAASTKRSSAEGIPFNLSVEEGAESFERWVKEESGLLRVPRVLSVKPMFLPHWHVEGHASVSRPGEPSTATHVDLNSRSPLSQVYGGHNYRRAMVEVAKNRGGVLRPFRADMLVPGVEVDEWSVYETTALTLVREQVLHKVVGAAAGGVEAAPATVHLTVKRTRRVFHPVFLVEYQLLGRPWRVFINGVTGEAHGIVHDTLVARARRALRDSGLPWQGHGLVWLFASLRLLNPAFLFKSVVGGALYAAYRRYAAVAMQQESYRTWEAQKARELEFQRAMEDTWIFRAAGDSSASARDEAHPHPGGRKERRRASTSTTGRGAAEGRTGVEAEDEGFWRAYRDEANARERAERERAQQARREREEAEEARRKREEAEQARRKREKAEEAQRKREREEQARRKRERENAKWQHWRDDGVDEDDYYAVLGLPGPEATSEDVKKAFRLQMMKWHPDHAREVPSDVANQRSQAIVKAYGVLRNPRKREAYDETYQARESGLGALWRRWRG